MKEVSTEFGFEGPEGEVGFLDLFDGRRQLILYHFWFPPEGDPCRGCSMVGDQISHLAHVNARDTTFAFVSRAPQAELRAFTERMGWEIPWYTDTLEFQEAYDTTEWFAFDVFLRDGDRAFQTYRTGRAGWRRSAPSGASSTARRWAARRSGRTRRPAGRRRRPTAGGSTTTSISLRRSRVGPSFAPQSSRCAATRRGFPSGGQGYEWAMSLALLLIVIGIVLAILVHYALGIVWILSGWRC